MRVREAQHIAELLARACPGRIVAYAGPRLAVPPRTLLRWL